MTEIKMVPCTKCKGAKTLKIFTKNLAPDAKRRLGSSINSIGHFYMNCELCLGHGEMPETLAIKIQAVLDKAKQVAEDQKIAKDEGTKAEVTIK